MRHNLHQLGCLHSSPAGRGQPGARPALEGPLLPSPLCLDPYPGPGGAAALPQQRGARPLTQQSSPTPRARDPLSWGSKGMFGVPAALLLQKPHTQFLFGVSALCSLGRGQRPEPSIFTKTSENLWWSQARDNPQNDPLPSRAHRGPRAGPPPATLFNWAESGLDLQERQSGGGDRPLIWHLEC